MLPNSLAPSVAAQILTAAPSLLLLLACFSCLLLLLLGSPPPLSTNVVRLGLHFPNSAAIAHRLLRLGRPFVRSSLFELRASIHPLHFQVSPGPACLAFLPCLSLRLALHCFRPWLPLPSTRAISRLFLISSVHSISGPSILFFLLLLLLLLPHLLLPRLPSYPPTHPSPPLLSYRGVVVVVVAATTSSLR